MSSLFSRRDRAPASEVADDGELRRAQRRVAALHAGIWLAVATGPLALAFAVAAPQMASGQPVVQAAAPTVISPPTGYAELFIDLWLRSSQDGTTGDALHAMAPMVDLPQPASGAQAGVQRVVAVRSTPMGGRTWLVTVAATMVLPSAAVQGDASAQGSAQGSIAQAGATQSGSAQTGGGAQSRPVTVRYFAVPVSMVRSSGSGGAPDALAVTAAPAQVAAPAALAGADPAAKVYGAQIGDGALQQTVTGYLTAYLTGVGDSSRYLAPGAKIPAAGAAYTKVELVSLGAAGPVPASPADGAVLDVQAQVRATDTAGSWPLTYPLRLKARAGRWEIAALAPVSSSPGASASPTSVPVPSTSAGVR